MSYASSSLRVGVRRLLLWQLAITFSVGGGIWFSHGHQHAVSALYGGLLSVLIALLLGWSVHKSTSSDFGFGAFHLYFGVIERFILLGVGVWVGMGWLRLPPFPLIAGFTATQAGYLFKIQDDSKKSPRKSPV